MHASLRTDVVEKLISQDRKLAFTLTSYVTVLVTYLNLDVLRLSSLGLLTFALYFLINGVFLGHAFFGEKPTFLRSMLGILLLIMLLGFTGLLAVLIYNLNNVQLVIILFVTTTLSSLFNKKVKKRHAT